MNQDRDQRLIAEALRVLPNPLVGSSSTTPITPAKAELVLVGDFRPSPIWRLAGAQR